MGDLANMLQPTQVVHLPAEMLAASGGFPIAGLQPTDGRAQGNGLCSELTEEHFQPPCCALGLHNPRHKTPESVQRQVWQADFCSLRHVNML